MIKTDTEEEQEEEEPLEKPEQIEVEIGDKTYVICEDITEEDAPAGFKLAKAKYGEKEVTLNRLKMAKRDGNGTKTRG